MDKARSWHLALLGLFLTPVHSGVFLPFLACPVARTVYFLLLSLENDSTCRNKCLPI